MRFQVGKVEGRVVFVSLTLFLLLTPSAYPLPKNQQQLTSGGSRSAEQQSVRQKISTTPTNPVVIVDDEILQKGYDLHPVSGYRNLGPSRLNQAGVPYIDVRVGIPETPGGQNHMRRQLAVSSSGVVHMVCTAPL